MIGADEAGRITWTPKGAAGAAGSTPAVAEPTVVDKTTAQHAPAQTAPEAPAAAPAPAAAGALGKRTRRKAAPVATPEPPAEPEPAPEPVPAEAEAAESEEVKRGRKPQGFTLLIGALPERAKTTGVIGLDQEFERFGTELAREMGAESYFALDGYKRRDWLAMRARQIAETFGSKIVTAVGDSPDFREFLAAIKPYASYVYVGVGR